MDVPVTDMGAKSYCHRDPAKVLITQEKEKTREFLEACLEQRCHFTQELISRGVHCLCSG
jgi:hypothetical protein